MESFEVLLLSTSYHRDRLLQLLAAEDPHSNFSFNVDFLKLFEADPNLGDEILCNPKNILSKCDDSLIKAQKKILENEPNDLNRVLTLKKNVHARFFGLPVCPELHRSTVPQNKDLGCFLKITGTAIRITQSKMLEYRRHYKCSTCLYIQIVEGKYEHRYVLKTPAKCNNPDIQCRSTTLIPVYDISRENCKDYQEMKIQEQMNKLTVGGIPGSIWVTLEDDLVDSCKPGDDVSICGTVMRRWQPVSANKKCEVELVIQANHIEVCNTEKSAAVSLALDIKSDFNEFWSTYKNCPMVGRDVILASICPKVYGLYMVKLALTLTIITSCNHNLNIDSVMSPKTSTSDDKLNESNVRGQCHLLLVGDPGTGKSQLLKAAAVLTSRSVLTSGSGSTKAGLTCTALREDGEWQLEAGALVLADGGVCCIDELAQMREHDRASIHEAMEQQTISIAKAGMVCKLNTRCAVIAACNPKGNYDTEQALSVNVSLGTPLLSRFDLIFILLDMQNKEWDSLVADYILFGKQSLNHHIKSWPIEKLQLYLSLIGPYDVSMTQTAISILQAYYVSQRRAENRDPSRTTVRMLDSLVRLSQAHARLMYRTTVLPMDAITAVSLMDLSMQDCVLTGSSSVLHTTFSKYPDFVYLKSAKEVLTNLNLHHIWNDEIQFYARLLHTDAQQICSDIENDEPRLFKSFVNSDDVGLDTEHVVESNYFKFVGDSNKSEDFKTYCSTKNVSNSDSDEKLEENSDCNNKIVTELLAKTLKKHSSLNKRDTKVGIITGKQKKVRNTHIKQKKTKSPLIDNNVSKENQLKRKMKTNTTKNTKKKRVLKSNHSSVSKSDNEIEKSSEDETDHLQALNCLPSVNDVFDGLKINFSLSSDESNDAIFEKSPKANSELINSITKDTSESPDKDEDIFNKINLNLSSDEANDSIFRNSPKVITELISSVVKDNTESSSNDKNFLSPTTPISKKALPKINPNSLNKLKNFSFSPRKNKTEVSTSAHIINDISTKSINIKSDDGLKKSNNENIFNGKPSQTSIFESNDDDYDVLDI